MKKSIIIVAILAIIGLAAQAGFDQYTQKNYTTLLVPTAVGVSYNVNGTTNAVAAVTNSATTGVDCIGLPGVGALVFPVNPGGGIVTMTLQSCATTNGSYVTITNAQGASSWAATGTATVITAPVRPNTFSRYWRTIGTVSSCTNGSVGAVLVTE